MASADSGNPLLSKPRSDGFAWVAFWQMMSFLLLILLVWVDEVLDLTSLWFGIRGGETNFYRGWVITIGIIIVAIITVGHTYLQQKRIIRGLLLVCSQCRKIRVDDRMWRHLDHYIADHSLALVSHGLCPECFEQAKQQIEDYSRHGAGPGPG